MATTATVIEFTDDDISPLVERMDALTRRGDGWINIGPGLTPEEFAALPTRSTVAKWVSGRGPAVPMATWTPASTKGRGSPAQIGLAHGTGPNALERLKDAGLSLPSGWQKKQDHAKNGIVAELPATVDHEAVIGWLLAAISELSDRVAAGPDWIAEAYGG
jgi:hypothetical protein